MLLPLTVGGGTDEATKAYNALRSAEGIGGSARNDSGIDGLWRRSMALGLSASTSSVRRAFNNAYPMLATDMLSYYERGLGAVSAPGAGVSERQDAVMALWPAASSADVPSIVSALRRIDPRFTFEATDETQSTTCDDGRWFDATATEGSFQAPRYSELAGPTTRYRYTAFLNVDDPGNMLASEWSALEAAHKRLTALLPAWVGFEVSPASDGFTLDESPLDWTVMADG